MNETESEQAEPKVMHLRIPAELHARLSTFASATHRSKNGAAVFLLEDALARIETTDHR